jgi:hypothetical protein
MMSRLHNLFHLVVILPALLFVQTYGNPSAAPSLMTGYNKDPLEDNVESPQCNVDVEGFYGENTVNETPIEFKYELEYKPESSIDEVLPALERAILDKVLPTLFGGECEMRQLRRRLQAVGASINPSDIEIVGCEFHLAIHIACRLDLSHLWSLIFFTLQVDCTLKLMNYSSCAVMDGKMTIYTDDGAFVGTDAVKEEIKRAMNDGNFNTISDVVNVFYVDDQATAPVEGDEGSGTQSTPTNNGLAPPFYAVIAVAGALVVVIAGVLWRRKDKDTTSVLSYDSNQMDAAAANAGLSQSQEVTQAQNDGALDFTPIS